MFGGMIQREGTSTYPDISVTPYGRNNYYVLNFNDVLSSLGTLFTLLLVSNMHVIVTGFTAVTIGVYGKMFVISWYCIGTLLFLNLLMASLLTSFISFWFSPEASSGEGKEEEEAHASPSDSILQLQEESTTKNTDVASACRVDVNDHSAIRGSIIHVSQDDVFSFIHSGDPDIDIRFAEDDTLQRIRQNTIGRRDLSWEVYFVLIMMI